MKSYKIYGKISCSYCMKLVQILLDKKKTFYVEFLDAQPDRLDQLKATYKQKTVPIVILKDGNKEELLGGCDDTLKFLKSAENKNETV